LPEGFDAVVVGAGPAGSTAALELARAGRSVCLLERGPFPGAKNMFGGVVYGRVLDGLIPRWWEEAPIQRWVTRRSTMILTAGQALTVDFRTAAWGCPPYNGATAYRSEWDLWLAGKAEQAGATVLTSTTATGLLRNSRGRVSGVRTDRAGGEILAQVVIACDGVNSFLAKEAGLHRDHGAEHLTLGAKEVLQLPREEIDKRFNLSGLEGADIEILGGTGEVPGGAFVYTNLDTVAVGVILQLPALAAGQRRPEEFIGELKVHPAVAPLVRGGELKEYSAHLIPEGGYKTMPELIADGLLVAGDAASMTLAAGIWLEGVNFAIASGAAAGRTAAQALERGDVSARGLRGYRTAVESTFVLKDLKRLRRAPGLVLGERMQSRYPGLVCDLVEGMFTVDNPEPKPGLRKLLRNGMKRRGLRLRDVARDGLTAYRSFG
jgi:electron transfer flavoprotein-quinone oxidoreductase